MSDPKRIFYQIGDYQLPDDPRLARYYLRYAAVAFLNGSFPLVPGGGNVVGDSHLMNLTGTHRLQWRSDRIALEKAGWLEPAIGEDKAYSWRLVVKKTTSRK